MIRTSRMSSLIHSYIIRMYSRLSRDSKRKRKRDRREKNNKESYWKKSKDNRKYKIRYWPTSEDKKRMRKPEQEWSNLD
jgi:hypothetical protein